MDDVANESMTFEKFEGKSVLVVGASGFFGRHVIERLGAVGAEVTAFSRSVPKRMPPNVVIRQGDASDPSQVAAAFAAAAPDVVYHLTSDSMGGREAELIPTSMRNDVLATLNVLLEAKHRGTARVVMTGSMEEPSGEAAEAVPSSPYAAAKWVTAGYARMLASLHDLPVVVLRLMMTYGPGQKAYKVVPATMLSLLENRPIKLGSGSRLVDWVYIDAVTDAFMRAAVAPYPGAASIDIGSGQLVSVRECLETIGDLTGRPHLLNFGALPDRPMEMVRAADGERAARLLDWRPSTTLRDGLARTQESRAGVVPCSRRNT
ncbi:MAG: NAD-dependent epimerase/dehydratase family protein [Burkholderiales bacterium]